MVARERKRCATARDFDRALGIPELGLTPGLGVRGVKRGWAQRLKGPMFLVPGGAGLTGTDAREGGGGRGQGTRQVAPRAAVIVDSCQPGFAPRVAG